jgi:hypothetical protein
MSPLILLAWLLGSTHRVVAPPPSDFAITASRDFKYVGTQSFDFYGKAHAEQHFFVDADRDGTIRRMYWIQFEHYLPGTDDRYSYPPPNDKLGHLTVEREERFRPAGVVPSPESDAGHAVAFLAAKGLNFAAENYRVRFIHLPDATNRSEVMIVYQEDARGRHDPVWADVVARAKKDLKIEHRP